MSVHKAAITVEQLLKDYNINTKDQLDKETGLLVNLIYDLENKYADEVEKLAFSDSQSLFRATRCLPSFYPLYRLKSVR